MSWISGGNSHVSTSESVHQWNRLVDKNNEAKLVCIDLQPYVSVQVPNQRNVMNIAGFSDNVFHVIEKFVKNSGNFVEEIESVGI
jgi:60 kDa SS-A/Ro ribonucleoprotein